MNSKYKAITIQIMMIIAILMFFGDGISFAQDHSQSYKDCVARPHIVSYSDCFDQEINRLDEELNVDYKKLYNIIGKYRRDWLQTSQSSWKKFLKDECYFEGTQNSGGPLGIVAQGQEEYHALCVMRETTSRIRILNQLIEGQKGSPG